MILLRAEQRFTKSSSGSVVDIARLRCRLTEAGLVFAMIKALGFIFFESAVIHGWMVRRECSQRQGCRHSVLRRSFIDHDAVVIAYAYE